MAASAAAAASSTQQPVIRGNKRQKKHLSGNGWSPRDYPYETDYNDHFETPLEAYQDTKPMIEWLLATAVRDGKATPPQSDSRDLEATNRSHCGDANIIGNINTQQKSRGTVESSESTLGTSTAFFYDPYYCNGRTATLLRSLGYENVIHEKRDFYADIETDAVPAHDIFVSNPPYSDTHKKRCLEYCLQRLRGESNDMPAAGTPFLILMPAYTASKQYYRDCLGPSTNGSPDDVVYLVPSTPYHYDHPDHTGKDQSPFDSLWFCGIGKERVATFQRYWESLPTATNRPSLVTSLRGLEATKVISLQNRPNPRQRGRKRKQTMMQQQQQVALSASDGPPASCIPKPLPRMTPTKTTPALPQPGNEAKSKYRDASSGKRTKKRF